MNILITGVAGFIGFHLAKKHLDEGHTVIGVDNYISGQKTNVKELSNSKKFIFMEDDVNNLSIAHLKAKLPKSITGITQIFHMGCPASPPIYQKDQLFTLDTCYIGSKNLLNIAKHYDSHILLASTSEIYGDPLVHPQSENYRGNTNTFGPRACYDEGKRTMETLGYIYRDKGTNVRIARIFNTYGPYMSPYDGRVVVNFITQAIQGKKLTVYGNGSQTRSFCYISDLVHGLCLLINSQIDKPVNLGSQFEHTVLEVAKLVRNIINPSLEIVFKSLPIDDPKQRRPDLTIATSLLNWRPTITLEQGINSIVEELYPDLVLAS